MSSLPSTLLFLVCAACSVPNHAKAWQVDHSESQISFFAIQEGIQFPGKFERFQAQIVFDPDKLNSSYFKVAIDTTSVNTQAKERDDILRSREFFDTERWPDAFFKTTRIVSTGEHRYEATALLKIRDIERPVHFPFQLTIQHQQGQTTLIGTGKLSINRFDFNLAQGEWSDTQLIGTEVLIKVRLKATQQARENTQ